MSDKVMRKYCLPVYINISGRITVMASSPEEAIKKAKMWYREGVCKDSCNRTVDTACMDIDFGEEDLKVDEKGVYSDPI